MIDKSYGFPQMATIIPATEKPEGAGFFISHQVLDEEKVKHERMMAAMQGDWTCRGLEAGTYCVLHEKRGGMVNQWMSDTWLERFTNYDFLLQAHGHVLVVGLGIGMLPVACLQKPEVKTVTVLEIVPAVIDLVEPHIRDTRLIVLEGDAFDPPFKDRLFDCIYLDIWQGICSDNWETMKPLLRRYRAFANKGGLVTAWLKDYVQDEAKKDRNSSWGRW